MAVELDLMPSHAGRVFVVTGANAGVGYETTLMLARTGATVVMACRNAQKASVAKQSIEKIVPGVQLEVMTVDLGDLTSVLRFAGQVRDRYGQVDVLINNAGVIFVPRGTTVDGFETHFGTNVLRPFLLTSLLVDVMPDTAESRVVTMTSNTHKWYRLDFDDLQSQRSYSRTSAYGRSKLANLLFALELQRRLDAAGSHVLSVATHPGMSNGTAVREDQLLRKLLLFATAPLNNPVAEAAKPPVIAALAREIRGGDYIGPQGFLNFRGTPGRSAPAPHALDVADARNLWESAEKLTGATWIL